MLGRWGGCGPRGPPGDGHGVEFQFSRGGGNLSGLWGFGFSFVCFRIHLGVFVLG